MRSLKLNEIKEGQIVFYNGERTYIHSIIKSKDGSLSFEIANQRHYEDDEEGKFSGYYSYIYFSNNPNPALECWKHFTELEVDETLKHQNHYKIGEMVSDYVEKITKEKIN